MSKHGKSQKPASAATGSRVAQDSMLEREHTLGTRHKQAGATLGVREGAGDAVRNVLSSPGHPLDANTRTAMEPRFPQLTVEQLNEQQKPLGEQILKVSSVGLAGPYNPLLRSPVLGQRMFDLLYYLRWNTSVPLRLNEFAILIIGRQWRSQVEWFAHAPLAVKAGLSPEIVTELKANKRPANMKPDEAVVYDFVTELSAKHQVSDETFKRARELLGEQ